MGKPNQQRQTDTPIIAAHPHFEREFVPQQITIAGSAIQTTPIFDAYWQFAAERQRIFFRRIAGFSQPDLTSDAVLSVFKFTNAYRASDRVSQYLIRNVIYRDDLPDDNENILFRILLFKLFNKIQTWESLEREFGKLTLTSYDFESFNDLLSHRQDSGLRNYSAAYIMPSAGRVFGHQRKHSNHLKLIDWILTTGFADKLFNSSSMHEGYELMMTAPSLGPFLAYQLITDINYSPITDYSENEFVVAGPGALDGISKCFVNANNVSPSGIIKHIALMQGEYFAQNNIDFDSLWGRNLQLIDCQNLFCEISKYSRVAFPEVKGLSGRTRIKQKYKTSGAVKKPWYPPNWRINEQVERYYNQGASLGSEMPMAEQLAMAL